MTKDTHFYATDLKAVNVSSVDRVVCRCPFSLWDELDELLDAHPGHAGWNRKRKDGGLQ
ncbi:MAG: hypothetical protein IPF92_13030 [Myxococcales bacterium]|nr:hypothetical protein [Myxococcales bacterium]